MPNLFSRRPSRLVAYTLALLLVLPAIGLTFLYYQVFTSSSEHHIFVFFYLAVCLSTWYGGRYPGLATVVLSTLVINYFFIPHFYGWIPAPKDAIRVGLYAGVMLLFNWLITEFLNARQKVEALTQQQLQHSELLLQQALQAANLGVWDYDLQTKKIAWSPEHEQLFGLAPGTFDGRYETFAACVHPDDLPRIRQSKQQVISQKREMIDTFRVVWTDGSVHWVESRGQLFCDPEGQPLRISGIVMGIDDRMRAEQTLQQLNQELEARVEQRTIALQEQETRLSLALKSGEIGTWDWNLVHEASWDDRMYELYGLQHLDRPAGYEDWINALHPDDRERAQAELQAALRGEREFDTEFRVIYPDGSLHYLKAFATVQRNGQGEPQRMVGINYDISEAKHLEAVRQQAQEALTNYAQEIEDLYNHAPCGYHSLDPEGRYIRVNETELELLGYSREDVIGQPLTQFLTEASRQKFTENYQNFQAQGWVKNLEYDMLCKDGTILPVMISATAVTDAAGNYLYNRATLIDIRERKQVEEQLRLSTDRISLANAELSRAARLKDEFLAGMSHELRTPLNAILGMSEILLEEIHGRLTRGQHEAVTLIERSGEHLLALINDILDLAKVESGKLDLVVTTVQIQHLCETSLSFVKQQAYQKHLHLTCNIDATLRDIELDERRIEQVLINLLNNAVKFTPEGGRVDLSVSSNPEQEAIEFTISDTGIGIAPDQLHQLFQPFVQLDSSLSRRYTGTGLGLALVRRIVELHGGSVTVTSELGQGSRFTVILPQAKINSQPIEALPAEGDSESLSSIQRVLIVEDSESAANQVARYLAEMGITTDQYPLGQGTVNLALQNRPDVIILDLLLPDLSGWEVLTALKNHPQTKTIPVLIVSVVEERAKGLALGAANYLLKPITRLQLRKALSQLQAGIGKSHSPVSLSSPLIVLAEDNEANIGVTLNYLQAHDLRTAIARNGLEAVQLVKQSQPDLVLMDIQMPEMDGLEAIRLIRSHPNQAALPIIAVTALAMPGDRERCLTAGANEYLTKPVSLKQLLKMIKQYLPDWSA